jgi:hypothetical protein
MLARARIDVVGPRVLHIGVVPGVHRSAVMVRARSYVMTQAVVAAHRSVTKSVVRGHSIATMALAVLLAHTAVVVGHIGVRHTRRVGHHRREHGQRHHAGPEKLAWRPAII